MKYLLLLSLIISLQFCACSSKVNTLEEHSIYHLASEWENQNEEIIRLADLKDKVVVMVMIYTSCRTACPRLTADMKAIAEKIGKVNPKDIRYVFISIDPATDTAQKMKEYLATYSFTGDQWLFLRSSEDNTRELANVLAVKYKEISPIDFSHSNIISVFNKQGALVSQHEGLNIDTERTANEVKKQLKIN